MTDRNQANKSLSELLQELNDDSQTVKAALVYGLSDLSTSELEEARQVWPEVDVGRRRAAMARLAESSETNYELDFTRFAEYALGDDDEQVRKSAIEALWFSEDRGVMRRLINLLENDLDDGVRSAAAQGLGRFVLAGELGDLPEDALKEVEQAILRVCRQADMTSELYLRAFESIAYSGLEEVAELIEKTAKQEQVALQAAALFAMGRSGDDRWNKIVLRSLNSDVPQLQFEAARAAGELMLESAVPRLVELSQIDDVEIQEAAITSLGDIGGQTAMQVLTQLASSLDNDELLEVVEDAISMAALSTGDFASYLVPGGEDALDDDDYYDTDESY